VPISFSIPLAQELDGSGCKLVENPTTHVKEVEGPCHVHYIKANGKEAFVNILDEVVEEVPQTDCPGTASAPTSVSGNLCVYEAKLEHVFFEGSNEISKTGSSATAGGASTSGAGLAFLLISTKALGYGTWAVTG
jgi:hypothetical protein